MGKMVDIHCHYCRPPMTARFPLEESVAMCLAAADEGSRSSWLHPTCLTGCTPHPRPGFIRERIDECHGGLFGENQNHARWRGAVQPRDIQGSKRSSHTDQTQRNIVLLLEFAFQMVPANIEMTIFQMLNAGVTPVIAHPETQQSASQQHPEILAGLIERGAFSQIDAGSLTKSFGAEPYESAKKIIEAGMAHFIATDAHHLERRRPILTDAGCCRCRNRGAQSMPGQWSKKTPGR
jgi:protein-tyrosine phosphatase